MRLHHLTVSAFGPFAGAEEVDFDELCDAGLFLLTGPTGAGKTTILDAICFALYGSVPGVRGVKALKSQHAESDARPEVVLDFSVRERRFRIRRSPEWTRPKRRGEGTVVEKAAASIVETTGGTEHFLSSRAQEVGHLVTELIGMQSTQFVQVAMLPQGEFQHFLRASTQERHEVLQHLFRSDRFARIEDWVHDHSRRLREASAAAEASVQRVLDTVADRCGTDLPEDVLSRAESWVAELTGQESARRAAAQEAHAQATAEVERARAGHEAARQLAGQIQRRDQARATLGRLAEQDAEIAAARSALAADDRAARCLPLLELWQAAVRDLEETTARRDVALSAAPVPAPPSAGSATQPTTQPTVGDLEAVEQQLRARITRLEGLLPRQAELDSAREALAVSEADLAAARRDLEALRTRGAELPTRLHEAEAAVRAATVLAARREPLEAELDRAVARLDAARLLVDAQPALVTRQDALRDARDRHADVRDHTLQLTARRLAGMAAELAGGLRPGCACQVCGSTDHPAPATTDDDPVTEAEQERAAADLQRAERELEVAAGAVTEAQRHVDALTHASAALSPADAAAAVADRKTQVEEASAAERQRDEATARCTALRADLDAVTEQTQDLTTRIATLEQQSHGHRETVTSLDTEIRAALGDEASLDSSIDRARRDLGSLTDARQAATAHQVAARRQGELEEQVLTAAKAQGFGDVAGVRAACLTADDRARLEDLLAGHGEERARAEAVLADPDIVAVGDAVCPDLEQTASALAAAEGALEVAGRTLHQADDLVASLQRSGTRLTEALAAWGPAREEYLRAEAMSKLVRGVGSDNQLQMRLSAYVLATRLDQVVAAANERLAHMRDQRYLLQRTGRAARKGSQAGLGLEVVDQWTGDVREPTTLSGGETFVVSLSLALGLADVVSQEAGGVEIETLFVDEGFGTLDADTLDDVMDRLDELRAGGRAVGVVSHVSELRNRIPTQLHVDKGRSGSAVRVRTLVG